MARKSYLDGKRILVADDEPDILESKDRVLRNHVLELFCVFRIIPANT